MVKEKRLNLCFDLKGRSKVGALQMLSPILRKVLRSEAGNVRTVKLQDKLKRNTPKTWSVEKEYWAG